MSSGQVITMFLAFVVVLGLGVVLAVVLVRPGAITDLRGDVTGICPSVGTVSLFPKAEKLFALGTSPGEYHYVWYTDPSTGDRVAPGSTADNVAASVAQNVIGEILFGWNHSTYYANLVPFTTGCDLTARSTKSLCLVDTTLDLFVKEPDGTLNTDAADKATDADDVTDYIINYKASAQRCWGNPNDQAKDLNIVVCEYDSSFVDGVSITIDGTSATRASAPKTFSTGTRNFTDGLATTSTSDSFYVSSISNGASQDLGAQVDYADTAIGEDVGNVICHFYDADADIDKDTNQVIWGVQDEDGNYIGHLRTNVSIHVS